MVTAVWRIRPSSFARRCSSRCGRSAPSRWTVTSSFLMSRWSPGATGRSRPRRCRDPTRSRPEGAHVGDAQSLPFTFEIVEWSRGRNRTRGKIGNALTPRLGAGMYGKRRSMRTRDEEADDLVGGTAQSRRNREDDRPFSTRRRRTARNLMKNRVMNTTTRSGTGREGSHEWRRRSCAADRGCSRGSPRRSARPGKRLRTKRR